MKIRAKEGVSARLNLDVNKYIFVTANEAVEVDESNEDLMKQVKWLFDNGLVEEVVESKVEDEVGEVEEKKVEVKGGKKSRRK